MHKHFVKTALLLLFAGAAIFFACHKNDTSQTTEDLLDQTLYSIQERGSIGKYGCYELVFPVTIDFPDSTSLQVNSYEEMKDVIRAWFDANGGGNTSGSHHHHQGPLDSGPHPTLAFPFTVITQDGDLVTVNNESELHTLKVDCGDGTFGHHDHHGHSQHGLACFEIQFPVTVQFPDSTTTDVADQNALHALLHDWKLNNPGSTDHPELVFPIQVIMKDDGTLVTVNSKDELHSLKQNCD